MFARLLKLIAIMFSACFFFLETIATPHHGFEWPETLQIHGFASQAFILTSDNRFFGDSETGSSDFRELGLNLSIRPIPDLQFSIQGLSRWAGEANNGDLRLDYGFLDYSLVGNESGTLGLRIGRVKNPLGFYNDTRDVAFTRPSIFLPQSIYFDRTRNLALSSDGINIYTEYRRDLGNTFFELAVSFPQVDNRETELAFLGPRAPELGHLNPRLSYTSRLIFEPAGGQMRFSLSGALVNIKFEPASPGIQKGDIHFRPLILSAQYNAEFWSLTSEYALRYSKFEDVGGPSFSVTGESYYLQGSYHLLDNLEALLRYDVLYQNREDRSGAQFAADPRSGGKPGHTRFAKDWTVGLRWNMTSSWMSRIEYHYVDGTGWLPLLDNPAPAETDRYWHLFALLISYRF